MPDMTGYDAARRIRREAWGRQVLLVAVTGWGQEDDKEKAQSTPASINISPSRSTPISWSLC